VQEARAHLTARHATGVDAVLWEARQRPMPDLDAIAAVTTTAARAQRGTGAHPEPMDVAAALVLLTSVHLNLDRIEALLLNTAQDAGMSFEQIAAILDLSVEEAEERHRYLKLRLDEPVPPPPAPFPGRASARAKPTARPRGTTWDGPNKGCSSRPPEGPV
jgi:hypothetical protein